MWLILPGMVHKKFMRKDVLKMNLWEVFRVLMGRGMAMCFQERREHVQKQGVERNAAQWGYSRSGLLQERLVREGEERELRPEHVGLTCWACELGGALGVLSQGSKMLQCMLGGKESSLWGKDIIIRMFVILKYIKVATADRASNRKLVK